MKSNIKNDDDSGKTTVDSAACGCVGNCGDSLQFKRRDFLKLFGAGSAGTLVGGGLFMSTETAGAAPFNYSLIPANKNLDPAWVASLFARGVPPVVSGASALEKIGMPVGGICCGQLYLAGDGRLWWWDIFNSPTSVYDTGGSHYANPLTSSSAPVKQGFALQTGSGASAQYFKLDSSGFANVTFLGQYPIGTVNYSDPACPVTVKLEAFSPFIPLNADDSGIPATVMEFTVTNPSAAAVEVAIAGWLQNAVCAFTPGVNGRLRNHATRAADHTRITGSCEPGTASSSQVLYDDFERTTYAPWVASGTAFGSGPVDTTDYPTSAYQSLTGFSGRYVINSHASASGDISQRDAATGTLTSPTFTLDYTRIYFLICGGNHAGLTCFNLCRASDNAVLMSATGADSNTYAEQVWDVSAWQGQQVYFQVVDNFTGGWGNIGVDNIRFSNTPRADIVFEDFERTTYAPWVATATTFGSGPVNIANVPAYQSPSTMGQHGSYLVNSHSSAPNSDTATGTLTSPAFTISRHFITFLIDGGNYAGQTCMNLVVGGQVVRTATGANSNVLSKLGWDVSDLEGQAAQLQIVDSSTGATGWGNIGIDYIVFSDTPPSGGWVQPANAADNGTLSLALLNPQAGDKVSLNAPVDTMANLFASLAANAPADATALLGAGLPLNGAIGRPLTLAPGAQVTVTFVIGWNFPKTKNNNAYVTERWGFVSTLQKYYATRFADADAVVAYVAANYPALAGQTRLWRDTWYDSSLPYWFLDRTFANTSTLATATSHRFSNGRFWGWEGTYCCEGTCGHVWGYAQAMGRIFPVLEQYLREHVDLNPSIGLNSSTGEIQVRGEFGNPAVDGQAMIILRAYRDHQMSADSTFLTTNWANIKKATQYLMTYFDADSDGILEGGQPNTLDATWYGKISWLSGLYIAACQACRKMALEMGDTSFASQLGIIAQAGADYLKNSLFHNDSYFIQLPDSAGNNIGTGYGCEIDQVLGQSWAFQVGLGQIFDTTKTLSALEHLWTYNFAPDAGGFRINPANPVSGGRNYAEPGESGLVMSTFPDPAHPTPTAGTVAGYFNECMSGFEHEVASHMIWAGRLQDGLAVTRAIHDRYSPTKRNPYNEIECGDHYARAMASYGSFIAICGYEYHGPKGYLAFSPKLTPENFKAPFTTAEGWGSYSQQRSDTQQLMNLTMRQGQLRLSTFAFDVAPGAITGNFQFLLNGVPVSATTNSSGGRITVALASPLILTAGQSLAATVVSKAPVITTVTDGVNGCQLTWQSVPGKTYTVQCSDDLLPAGWRTLQARVAASAGLTTTFTDATAPGHPLRFYRIHVEP